MSHHPTRRRSLAAATMLVAASAVAIVARPADATTTLSPTTAFEIDGNPTVDGNGGVPSSAVAGDWDGAYPAGLTPSGAATTGVYYQHRNTDPCGSATDDVAVGGDKAEDGPVWRATIGQPNAKTDLAAISFAAEKVVTNDAQIEDVLYASFERCGGSSGSMSTLIAIDDGDGIPPSAGDDGDHLFRFDFDPSRGQTTLTMMTRTGGQWVLTAIPAGAVDAAAAPAPGDFGEVAINLTRLGVTDASACREVTVAGQGSTITGADLRSQPKDIVRIEPFTISNCGALEITKAASPSDVTTDDRFTYVVEQHDGAPVHDATLGVSGGASTSEPDVDTAEIDATIAVGETHLWTNVISQPDYLLAETVLPSGWATDSIVCTYSDIFRPLPNSTEVIVYADGAATGAVFHVTPSSFANQALPPASCRVTNSATAVVVAKAGTGDAAQQFEFSVSGHDPVALTIGQASAPLLVDPTQPVTITESAPTAGWQLTEIACVDESQNIVFAATDPTSSAATFVPVLGEVVTCTFTNIEDVPPTTTTTTTTTTTVPPTTTTTTTVPPTTTTTTTTTTVPPTTTTTTTVPPTTTTTTTTVPPTTTIVAVLPPTTTIVAVLPPTTTTSVAVLPPQSSVAQEPVVTLPRTGADGVGETGRMAALLLALGAVLLVVARPSDRRADPPR